MSREEQLKDLAKCLHVTAERFPFKPQIPDKPKMASNPGRDAYLKKVSGLSKQLKSTQTQKATPQVVDPMLFRPDPIMSTNLDKKYVDKLDTLSKTIHADSKALQALAEGTEEAKQEAEEAQVQSGIQTLQDEVGPLEFTDVDAQSIIKFVGDSLATLGISPSQITTVQENVHDYLVEKRLVSDTTTLIQVLKQMIPIERALEEQAKASGGQKDQFFELRTIVLPQLLSLFQSILGMKVLDKPRKADVKSEFPPIPPGVAPIGIKEEEEFSTPPESPLLTPKKESQPPPPPPLPSQERQTSQERASLHPKAKRDKSGKLTMVWSNFHKKGFKLGKGPIREATRNGFRVDEERGLLLPPAGGVEPSSQGNMMSQLMERVGQRRVALREDVNDDDDDDDEFGDGLNHQLTMNGRGRLGKLKFDMDAFQRMELDASDGRRRMRGPLSFDLHTLLSKKYHKNHKYSPMAVKEFKKLIELSGLPISKGRGMKYRLVRGQLKQYDEKPKKKEVMKPKTRTRFVYLDSLDEALERLNVLVGSLDAGKKSDEMVEEISVLLDILKKKGQIDDQQYQAILNLAI